MTKIVRRLLALLALSAGWPAWGQDDAIERCILREFAQAEPGTTVQEIRRRCETPPKPAAAPASAPATSVIPSPQAVRRNVEALLEKPAAERTPFESRFASEFSAYQERFALLPHRPTYLLPVTYQARRDEASGFVPFGTEQREIESTFQVSFKFPLTPPLFGERAMLFFGYTGRSWWQVYDRVQSRPFREYNHEPEVFVAVPGFGAQWFGWRHRMTTLSLNHQSNGRALPYSRSWNRLIGEAVFDRDDKLWASLRLWYRFREDAKAEPNDTAGDDNPDITRYMGHGELRLGYAGSEHNLTLMLRAAANRRPRGAMQLDYSHPTGFAKGLRWHVHWFDGYGESLVDYNVRLRRVGFGVMLSDWF